MTRKEAEAIRAEAARTGDESLIRAWNAWCIEESKRMDAAKRQREQGRGIGFAYIALWGG